MSGLVQSGHVSHACWVFGALRRVTRVLGLWVHWDVSHACWVFGCTEACHTRVGSLGALRCVTRVLGLWVHWDVSHACRVFGCTETCYTHVGSLGVLRRVTRVLGLWVHWDESRTSALKKTQNKRSSFLRSSGTPRKKLVISEVDYIIKGIEWCL